MDVLETLSAVRVVEPTDADVLLRARAALLGAIADEEHGVPAAGDNGAYRPGSGGAAPLVVSATKRRRRRIVVALAAAAVVIGASVAIIKVDGPSSDNRPNSATGPVTSPSWKLVSDVNQSSWQEPPTSGFQSGLSLTCPTASTCFVEDAPPSPGNHERVEVTHDGGATWQQSTLPGELAFPADGLDCVDASTCVTLAQSTAGSDVFVMTDDGGQTWTSSPGPTSLPSSFVFSDISCTSTTSCVAVGFGNNGLTSVGLAAITTDGGKNWSGVNLPNGFVPMNDRCFAGGDCIAIGDAGSGPATGAALYSQDGGSTWLPASVPTGVGSLGSVSCSDASYCLATAATANGPAPGDVLSSTDGGKNWQALSGGIPTSLLMGVSCASASLCWVSGAVVPSEIPWTSGAPISIGSAQVQGLLATTQDGGQSWQIVQPSPSLAIGVVPAVSCPTATTCFALGYQRANSLQGAFVLLSYQG